MISFKGADRNQLSFMPHDLNDWLPEDHLARFVVEIVDQMDLRDVYESYSGKGSTPYDPKLLLGLLFYGYSTGVFSSRKLETATYDSVAFRYIAGNHHPDHDTIASFRKRFLGRLKVWFKEILLIGHELGMVKVGNIFIDGSKIQANASKHKAMSYQRIKQLEQKLGVEIEQLLQLAEQQDQKEAEDSIDFPEEIKRRKERLAKIGEAKKVIEARRKEAYKEEKEAFDQKQDARKEYEERTGKRLGGTKPTPPSIDPNGSDQYNFTDPESRIMKTNKGFDQCYNAQIATNEDMLIVGNYANTSRNDRKEFLPTIDAIPEELKIHITSAVADKGYYSKANITNCPETITPIIAKPREQHVSHFDELINPIEDEQKQLYRKRKSTVEPVFGIIKEVLGFRRFSFREEANINSEWALVCLAYNLKRMFNMKTTC